MRRFWIDTDTASDDAVAILMALRWPDVFIEGISTVAGNVPLEMCNQNARYTVELCGKSTPVYAGASQPLLREPFWAYFFHGPDGMGGMNYPEAQLPVQQRHAVEAMIEAFRNTPGEITLVTLGPLTNIALALGIAPDISRKIKACYVMGVPPTRWVISRLLLNIISGLTLKQPGWYIIQAPVNPGRLGVVPGEMRTCWKRI
jgi:purine nucleosidase